ncbi:hypothetical protein COV06_02990 [Candidatus Uhrbacteria bacterium CG10_big_fil_rev_8_21_14_0_10_50_16]|uniref:Uncharacterized protein n=1 Tax=Candidatus Uhrbacteria bacterium CG10_big_fil_rev_8_21_14_0_10_50_16 TaxID=1975039 RepID=A0A2H0RLG7_9BACT|nr:MAG: hypothetical protein COV06_02990 [Candidatus Uhrbacteria bacterium CG10_big_fil_rev_8_21_14_0_10_50_16]
MNKRFLSPIIYGAFLILVLVAVMAVVIVSDATIGLLPFGMNGLLEILFTLLTLGTYLFWIGSKITNRGASSVKNGFLTHIYQSLLGYVLAIHNGSNLLVHGYYGGLGEAYQAIMLGVSLWAIVINAVYVYTHHKK